jgi:phospholipid/cholesterol/gamma-HCH transport system permease protein
VSTVLKRQLYFTGIESLSLIVLIAIAVGGIIVSQVHFQVGQSGSETLRLLGLITLNELAPLLTALILIARSSSAMASELAAMQVTGELLTLRRLGVPTLDYLLMPRVLGMVFSSLFLSLYFAAVAMLAAAFIVAGFNGPHELVLLADSLPFRSVGQGVVKSLLFGLAISLTACRAGLAGGSAMTDIPKAASKAVINSLLTVFALDLLVMLV